MPNPRIWGSLLFLLLAAAAAAAAIHHPTPRDRLRHRAPSPGRPHLRPPPLAPSFDREQQEYLRAHNDLRRRAGVPPLAWDPVLAAEARSWAEQRRGDCDYRRHSASRYGENIFWMRYREFDPADAVGYWFGEWRLYDHATNTCRCRPERNGCECGHYLGVIWSTTRRVGCSGSVYCKHQQGVYVVCNYDPPGLIPGVDPFTGLKLKLNGFNPLIDLH
ncbi:CAP (Cysteine-rich secretory proteins- Antigen 5-and Pathogenesis-related 1 protein) superfamily protein [Striga hermonthica]|uniref:CAP (Cysteine-rich secretory proteins- Antigen 5-and Pathogenesis-related 1 protein) superfamily protein n=1 Tax=Striga hermonthica TaxID=68872 RepID=A0A9N7NTG3_STRHE|nr:CAP (Cysteine-rich secretory proteins- Antigen 5-and Pathogenesis-related 1 protein) superfamily protein [Striga hermonthica]